MKKINLLEFTRRLRSLANNKENKIVFFIGAGCSISSGVPSAAKLTQKWIKQLKGVKVGNLISFEKWISSHDIYKSYTTENAADFYSEVINDLFPSKDQRRQEIETIVTNKDPGFQYSVLANLLSSPKFCIEKVLTTNFDDLIADALYIYTNKKPLVIPHEALIEFVDYSSHKPTIIKLHGDAHLSTKNTKTEIAKIDKNVVKSVKNIVRNSYVIFTGYGGNDSGIKEIFETIPNLENKVYWINDKIPKTDFGTWLENNDTIWVEHLEFDVLMANIFIEFELELLPFENRLQEIIDSYSKSAEVLFQQISDQKQEIREKLSPIKDKIVKQLRPGKDYEVVHLPDGSLLYTFHGKLEKGTTLHFK
jgi:protein O-mannosyl-transferase